MAKKKWSRWTDETVEKFKELYPYSTWDELLKEFPFSKKTMISKASKLGISRRNFYSEHEDAIILECYNNGMSDAEIAMELPGRSESQIADRRMRIGAVIDNSWSDEENALLTDLYGTAPAEQISAFFPKRSTNSIVLHAKSLGLSGFSTYHTYTEREHEFIRQNYLYMSDSEIGALLGHPACSIKNRRNKLGCHRKVGATKYEDIGVYIRRHNDAWKIMSMRSCGYKCVLSGERFDEIHHLFSQNAIIKNVFDAMKIDVSQFDINALSDCERSDFLEKFYQEQAKYPPGVCLTRKIHKHFHDEYGYGNNTPEQFYEFVERFYPNRLTYIA